MGELWTICGCLWIIQNPKSYPQLCPQISTTLSTELSLFLSTAKILWHFCQKFRILFRNYKKSRILCYTQLITKLSTTHVDKSSHLSLASPTERSIIWIRAHRICRKNALSEPMPMNIRFLSVLSNYSDLPQKSEIHRLIHRPMWISLNCDFFEKRLRIFRKNRCSFYKIFGWPKKRNFIAKL